MNGEKTCPETVLVPIDHAEAHALLEALYIATLAGYAPTA
jgi:hypothetical protein